MPKGPVLSPCPVSSPFPAGTGHPAGFLGMGGNAQLGDFFIWEPAYFLIGLGVNEWLSSVWSERGWALERVI